jgi:hypothetical protein
MKKNVLFISCLLLLLLTACSKDNTPSSLTDTSWKYSTQILKFTSSTAGAYTISSKSYSFTYTYTDPDITIKVSNGTTFDGSFSSTTSLKVVSTNSPTAAITFTKQ